MNELNQQIADIFKRYSTTSPVMIQDLFNLLPLHPVEQRSIIQMAILYTMQNMHEWQNIMTYTQKWQRYQFRHDLILRMRHRLQDNSPVSPSDNESTQLRRLIQKYWLVCSPKKTQNKYKEPINIKVIRKNTDRLTRKTEGQSFFGNVGRQSQFEAPSLKPIPQNNLQKISENQSTNPNNLHRNVQKEESNSMSIKRSDPISSLTGRPAILKKNSVLQPKNKAVKIDQNQFQDKKRNEVQQERYIDQDEVKQRQNLRPKQSIPAGDNFSGANKKMIIQISKQNNQSERLNKVNVINEENVQKQITKSGTSCSSNLELSPKFSQVESSNLKSANEPYPSIDQFNFGSNKKTNDADLKQFSVSPIRKINVGQKILRINRSALREQEKEINPRQFILQDFSFRDDIFEVNPSTKNDKNDLIRLATSSSDENHSNNVLQQIVQKDSKSEQQSQKQLGKQVQQTKVQNRRQSFPSFGKEAQTPYFELGHKATTNDDQFLSREQMQVVDKVQPSYLLNKILKMKGYDAMAVFQQIFSACS